ncbi:MAG: M15 family metallopeptidase [Schaedlerella sp.]|nr:M15 family metallopeptidase [Lachnospiraceae bacterium]MDY4202255.1 M15 family metallopeptidase [Schaedlerella sp.]
MSVKKKSDSRARSILRSGAVTGVIAGVLISGLATGRCVKMAELSDKKAQESMEKEVEELKAENLKLQRKAEGTGDAAEKLSSSDDDWCLALVNETNPLDTSYVPQLVDIASERLVDVRIEADARKMFEDAAAAGMSMYIVSAYRSYDSQRQVFNDTMSSWIAQGYTPMDAYDETKKSVAVPGISEHATGLALDITSSTYTGLDDAQAQTAESQWLAANAWKYGFILRYPTDKADVTGIIFEPWHYRYVGKEAAKEITERGITLEEYLEEQEDSEVQ